MYITQKIVKWIRESNIIEDSIYIDKLPVNLNGSGVILSENAGNYTQLVSGPNKTLPFQETQFTITSFSKDTSIKNPLDNTEKLYGFFKKNTSNQEMGIHTITVSRPMFFGETKLNKPAYQIILRLKYNVEQTGR